MQLKKIIRQFRKSRGNNTALVHLIINAKSNDSSLYRDPRKAIVKTLLNSAFEWEFYKKTYFIKQEGFICFTPNEYRKKTGNKTYYYNGKYHDAPELPF